MGPVSSLTNRVFLACTLLAMLSLGFAFYFVNERVSAEAEAELRRGVEEAGILVDQHRATLTDTYIRFARVVADLPKLKAAMATGDPPTVQPLADEYRAQLNADLFVLTGPGGETLGAAGTDREPIPPAIAGGRAADEITTFRPHRRGVLQMVSVPVLLGLERYEILGRLTVGFFLDDRLAAQFKTLTGSEIAFGAQGRILASTLPSAARSELARVMNTSGVGSVVIGDEEFLTLARPLVPASPLAGSGESGSAVPAAMRRAEPGLATDGGGPVSLTLRSRTERLRFLTTIRTGLAGVLVVTLLLATLLSYGVALTMTRPLAAITTTMREVAATGDLTRKVTLRSRAWADEDARLLASTFNTLTESLARFHRDAAQKERLSSLGRLSTVIAHEIRNPLMIIRASLSTLRRESLTVPELHEAVADIDEETTRLNRIVAEVLDFGRPIRFELAEANLNEICRESAGAAWTGNPAAVIAFDLDATMPPIVTDAERLRTALVNILTNARQAVRETAHAATGTDGPSTAARSAGATTEADVVVSTRRAEAVATVAIRDRGLGIEPEALAHIFDPYFTTRRGGTGLGLPIAKNIIEGLGGSLAVTSRPGDGTEIRIDLPLTPPTSRG